VPEEKMDQVMLAEKRKLMAEQAKILKREELLKDI